MIGPVGEYSIRDSIIGGSFGELKTQAEKKKQGSKRGNSAIHNCT